MESLNAQKQKLISSVSLPLKFLVLLWMIHLFQWGTGLDLGQYLGLMPMEVRGLKGIVFAPLIHGDFGHLISNSVPFFVLSVIVLFFYRKVALPAFFFIYFLTGIAVWIFARQNVFHIGASGVIYGLVAFVFWMGIFRKSVQAIILALIVTVLYSGMFLGVLPGQEGISWESHLMGGLVGIFTAYWFKNDIEEVEKKPVYSWEEEAYRSSEKFFLPPDAFEKTKMQRLKESEEKRKIDWTSDDTSRSSFWD
ncbi:MAG: rhomboid family intramembrane serine protease [Bacteroidota bacterium]